MMNANTNDTRRLGQAKQQVTEFKSMLPARVDSHHHERDLPFQANQVHIALRYRITELSDSTCKLYEANKFVSALILTRSIMETVAMLYGLHNDLEKAVDCQDTKKINRLLHQATLGSRNPEILRRVTSRHVLDDIKELDKKWNGTMKHYEYLSDFVHPNVFGVVMPYVKPDKIGAEFGWNIGDVSPTRGLTILHRYVFDIFKYCDRQMENLLPKLRNLCDRDQHGLK